jgi:hypothetical protein
MRKQEGKLFPGEFSIDNPFLHASGSNLGEVVIWDISESKSFQNHFGPRISPEWHEYLYAEAVLSAREKRKQGISGKMEIE